MTESQIPTGRRYDHLYLDRGEPTRDSARMRKRLAMLARRLVGDVSAQCSIYLESELGVNVPLTGGHRDPHRFFLEADLRDVLAAVTLIAEFVGEQFPHGGLESYWRDEVRRIMAEENVGYRVDDECGVHPLIDQQFEAERVAVVATLQPSRYSAVLEAFEDAHRALEEDPPDGKLAIRQTFEAAEILFKLISDTTKVHVLGTDEIREHLEPVVKRIYASVPALSSAADRFVNSFKNWVSAAHPFRHGQKTEVPLTVPVELAVAMVGSGAAYIRWLADIDRKLKEGS